MVRKFADLYDASTAAVKYITDVADRAVRNKGCCTIVLAGGSTPRLTYELLSVPANATRLQWQQCHFFWGDERWVPLTHPASNFAMAQKALFAKVHIPPQNIHPITTGLRSPEVGAALYEQHLHDFFSPRERSGKKTSDRDAGIPSFDLILLGMGSDGHTASLFAGSKLLEERKKWVAAVPGGHGEPPVPRITLTLPVINGAGSILFLIAGKRKKEILDTILTKPIEAEKLYPAARVKSAGKVVWLVAEKAD